MANLITILFKPNQVEQADFFNGRFVIHHESRIIQIHEADKDTFIPLNNIHEMIVREKKEDEE